MLVSGQEEMPGSKRSMHVCILTYFRLIRDGEVGRSGILYLTPTRYTVTTRIILHLKWAAVRSILVFH